MKTKLITSLDELVPGVTRNGLTYFGWLIHGPPLSEARPEIAICEVADPVTPGFSRLVAVKREKLIEVFVGQEVEVPE